MTVTIIFLLNTISKSHTCYDDRGVVSKVLGQQVPHNKAASRRGTDEEGIQRPEDG